MPEDFEAEAIDLEIKGIQKRMRRSLEYGDLSA